MDKYFTGDYSKFHVKSEDGTLDESIRINANLVKDIVVCVAFLRRLYESNLSDKLFEIFVEFSLIMGLKNINENLDVIIKQSGDDNGN